MIDYSNYVILPNAVPRDICEHIKEISETFDFEKGKTGGNDSPNEASISGGRESDIAWINYPWINSLFYGFGFIANKKFFDFDVFNEIPESCQYTKYEVGQEYSWHYDCWKKTQYSDKQRKLSVILQLTDGGEYTGGDFCVSVPNFEFGSNAQNEITIDEMRNIGSIIVFPSSLRHRVTPITSGTRKSLVGWIEGTHWR